ncbi:uncharacterized protein LOC120847811 [Ixodes scapularis]|uniref:uncharacterized protein LOC120847811 n=1 Tax=Ixodes scapularis TaxID=6945 RepID=UPI001AD7233A|nr:uncharacterized protein LOC120847811 [Ixodes scapularis]
MSATKDDGNPDITSPERNSEATTEGPATPGAAATKHLPEEQARLEGGPSAASSGLPIVENNDAPVVDGQDNAMDFTQTVKRPREPVAAPASTCGPNPYTVPVPGSKKSKVAVKPRVPPDDRRRKDSLLAYVLPFLKLGLTETNKLNCLIRKSYKRAIGIPDTTSNEKLAALGLHNTVEEIIEAQRVSQLERLTKSATGLHILASLGIRYERQTGEKADVPRRVREALVIPNIPKQMHPTHHAERRAARVKALQKRLRGGGAMVATAVNQQGEVISSCSIKTSEPEVAEEVAIALAIRVRGARIVVSDSQQAIRQFAKGRISTAALKVLGDPEKTSTKVQLIWTPAHSSLPGNEKAHGAARELAHRAGEPLDPSLAFSSEGDRLVTFRDILDHYTGERLRYPPAHPSLDKRTSVAWRRLQTGSFPSPSLLNKWYPDKYKPNCKLCGGYANLRHMVWECSKIDRKSHPLLEKIDNQESWETHGTLVATIVPSGRNASHTFCEDSQTSLQYHFRRAHNTVSNIVADVCPAIYSVLRDDFLKVL